MSAKSTIINVMAMLLVSAMSFTARAADDDAGMRSLGLFNEDLRQMLPPVISDFAERYLYERLNLDSDIAETNRKMKFDEVECTFSVTVANMEKLKKADGLSLDLERGKSYRIRWFSGEEEMGSMKFPASYNLIRFTDQVKSYRQLVETLKELAKEERDSSINFCGIRPDRVTNPFKRSGPTFYLRHLESSTYLDSITGRPLWTPEYPAESLANLFVSAYPVADIMAEIGIVAYDGKTETVRLPLHRWNALMSQTECLPYFGISEMHEGSGEVEALAVYHNADLSYIHKMEITANPDTVWDTETPATIKIRLTPYIKLHNLKDLWGQKKN